MSFLTGIIVVDAPASALNNAGADAEARRENAGAVKLIRTPQGQFPYVSAQALRYWLRTQLAREPGWSSSPVFRETKVAYSDAEPFKYSEDDIFGYMRAASKSTDEKKAAKRAEISKNSTPVDADTGEVTRISPLRVGTLVATVPMRPTVDFGTMGRAEGDPVPYEHQFYRAHLKAPVAIDLVAAGTFFVSKRVGFKNLDSNRIKAAREKGAIEVTVRGLSAWRLPSEARRVRVAQVIRALGRLEGGAKQTLHLTDTAPAACVFAICQSGNQPFQRVLGPDEAEERTVFRTDVLDEALAVFKEDIVSDLYVGWATGFLDAERKKLIGAMKDGRHEKSGRVVHLGHPREICGLLADKLLSAEAAAWFE